MDAHIFVGMLHTRQSPSISTYAFVAKCFHEPLNIFNNHFMIHFIIHRAYIMLYTSR